jgi:transposase
MIPVPPGCWSGQPRWIFGPGWIVWRPWCRSRCGSIRSPATSSCFARARIKLLVYDGTGLILITKRLEAGHFAWPPVTDGVVRLSALQLSVLLSGLPWERLGAPPISRPRAAC